MSWHLVVGRNEEGQTEESSGLFSLPALGKRSSSLALQERARLGNAAWTWAACGGYGISSSGGV